MPLLMELSTLPAIERKRHFNGSFIITASRSSVKTFEDQLSLSMQKKDGGHGSVKVLTCMSEKRQKKEEKASFCQPRKKKLMSKCKTIEHTHLMKPELAQQTGPWGDDTKARSSFFFSLLLLIYTITYQHHDELDANCLCSYRRW